jgi:hypothetical protein
MKQTRLKTLLLGILLFLICAIIGFLGLLSQSITALLALGLPVELVYLALTLPFIGLFLAITRILVGINIPNIFVPLLIILAAFTLGLNLTLSVLLVNLLLAYLSRYLISEFHLHFAVKTSIVMTLGLIGLVILLPIMQKIALFGPEKAYFLIIYSLLILAIINEKFLTFKMTRSSLWSDLKSLFKTLFFALTSFFILGGPIILPNTTFQWDWLKNIIAVYPESIFIALILTILIGRYTGLRLSEIYRFRKLIFKNN